MTRDELIFWAKKPKAYRRLCADVVADASLRLTAWVGEVKPVPVEEWLNLSALSQPDAHPRLLIAEKLRSLRRQASRYKGRTATRQEIFSEERDRKNLLQGYVDPIQKFDLDFLAETRGVSIEQTKGGKCFVVLFGWRDGPPDVYPISQQLYELMKGELAPICDR